MPAKQTAPTQSLRPTPRPERAQVTPQVGNAAQIEAMTRRPVARPAPPAPARPTRPTARPATPEYVSQSPAQKASSLASLYSQNTALLKANDVSSHMEAKLAGVSINEGGKNEARLLMGRGYARQAAALNKALKGRTATDLSPDELAAVRKRVPEDQQFLLDRAREGAVDLAGVSSTDKAVRTAAREGVTEAGIQHRTQQYTEMSVLQRKAAGPAKLTKDEKRRLASLERMRGVSKLGMGGRLGGMSGMSPDRFSEIYAPGQQRFEPAQYRSLRRSYQRSEKRHEADPKRKLQMKSGIGRFDVTPDMESSLGRNHDMIADMATSYGTSQIMGAYAQTGMLNGIDANGTEAPIGIDELKRSRDRLSPTSDDMRHQMAFMRMKGIDLGGKISNSSLTSRYNGSRRGSNKHSSYKRSIQRNSAAYLRAKKRQGG